MSRAQSTPASSQIITLERLLADANDTIDQLRQPWLPLDQIKPNPDVHHRVLIYTDGVDFAGEQVFDIKTSDLYPDHPDDHSETCAAATHWLPHPAITIPRRTIYAHG